MKLALTVLAACGSSQPVLSNKVASPVAGRPDVAMVTFDGPFASEAELCDGESAAHFNNESGANVRAHCLLTVPSFRQPAGELPGNVDRIASGPPPFLTVHVVPLMAKFEDTSNPDLERVEHCLLVIQTPRGWFASDRMIEHCEPDGGPWHSMGGFVVRDVIGDAVPELLMERGDHHPRPCGDCIEMVDMASSLCGVSSAGVPRCTPPMLTSGVTEDGPYTRSWSIRRPDVLDVEGLWRELDSRGPRPPAVRWHLSFD